MLPEDPAAPSLEDAVSSTVQMVVEKLLGAAIPADEPFAEAGLDSLGGRAGVGLLMVWCAWLHSQLKQWLEGAPATTSCLAMLHGCQHQLPPHNNNQGAVDLRNDLAGAFGLDLPATASFDYPTRDSMRDFIVSEMIEVGRTVPDWGPGPLTVQSIMTEVCGGERRRFVAGASCTVVALRVTFAVMGIQVWHRAPSNDCLFHSVSS